MRVLLIKTSSLGDILHALPALTDARQAVPNIQFDWVVEKSFQKIPTWHPSIDRVIPVALRSWRKRWQTRQTLTEALACLKYIRSKEYDVVLDAQGLLKSAILTLVAKGPGTGFSWSSAREKTASLFYHHRIPVSWEIHAVDRIRTLFATALNYSLPQTLPDYGIKLPASLSFANESIDYHKPYYIFLPYTTWQTKHWPTAYWRSLAKYFEQDGKTIILLPNNAEEEANSQQIADSVSNVQILPNLNLEEAANVLSKATAVVAVDTGLGHLAGALGIPTVSLYGPTDPNRTGTIGHQQTHLMTNFPCSPCLSRTCRYRDTQLVHPPCFKTISPKQVFEQVQQLKQDCHKLTRESSMS